MATIPVTIPASSKSRVSRPKKPYAGFPLFANLNGQWCRKVKGHPYYFGTWADDLKGERALADWNARQAGIMAGTDNLRVAPVKDGMALVELMGRFLKSRRTDMLAGDLSKVTYGDYVRELKAFVASVGENAVVAALTPTHFRAYADQLVKRNLGRHTRKRTIAYVKAMLNWGAGEDYHPAPRYGSGFAAPNTSPDAIRQAKSRAGEKDYSNRILTGAEVTKLIDVATPLFKGIILMSVNCGLGPADVGRLKWANISMETGELNFPRGKTGVPRRGYLWKQTRRALERVATLKHNAAAIKKDGDNAFVFVSRKGRAMYRETEVVKRGVSMGVKCENAISITFNRLAKDLKMDGVTHYRLRHTFKTLGKKARDKDALDLAMGHRQPGIGSVYDHEEISLRRLKRVALAVKHALWPKPKRAVREQPAPRLRLAG